MPNYKYNKYVISCLKRHSINYLTYIFQPIPSTFSIDHSPLEYLDSQIINAITSDFEIPSISPLRNNSFPPPKRGGFHPPLIKTDYTHDTRLSDLFYLHFTRTIHTHTYFSIFFLFPSSRYLTDDTWFLSMKMGIAMERKEKRVQNTKKSKKREKRRWIDLRFKLLEEFFSKLYPANPLCTCSVLDRDYNHHR